VRAWTPTWLPRPWASTRPRLPYAARLMGAGANGSDPGWLEVALSWPDRVIRPAWNTDLLPAATG
jgi:hypothetical protein